MSLDLIVYTFISFIVITFVLYMVLSTLSKWLVYSNTSYSNGNPTINKNVMERNGSMSAGEIQNGGSWETRRDMGHYESYLAELDSTQGTNIYAVISLKSRVTLRRELVQNALVLLARKHPLLRTIVDVRARPRDTNFSFYQNAEASKGKKQFVVLGERQYSPELRSVNTSHWGIVLEEELSVHKADSSVPGHLWHSILLREQYHSSDREGVYKNTLLFFFDRVIMDRLSVVLFINDFKNFLCKLVNCDIHISDTKPLQFPDCIENILKKPPFWKLLLFLFKESLHSLLNFSSTMTTSRPKDSLNKRKSFFLTKSISTEETIDLLKYTCRTKSSLTSLFISAWSELEKIHSENVSKAVLKMPVIVNVVVDLRGSLRTPLPASSLGNYSLDFPCQFGTSVKQSSCGSQFLASVERCDMQLNYALQCERHLDLLWEMKYRKKHGSTNFLRPSFEIAYLGQLNLVDSYPFLLEDIHIGASGTSDVSLTLVIVNSRLHCALNVTSDLADRDCTNLLNDLLTIVQHYLKTS